MAWYKPMQRRDGRWDYVSSNWDGDSIYPLGYCAGYHLLEPGDILSREMCDRENTASAPFKDKYHSNGHVTSAEAVNCHREYQLDRNLHFGDGEGAVEQRRCGICGTWTTGMGYIAGESHQQWQLCDAHRNRESVEQLWF